MTVKEKAPVGQVSAPVESSLLPDERRPQPESGESGETAMTSSRKREGGESQQEPDAETAPVRRPQRPSGIVATLMMGTPLELLGARALRLTDPLLGVLACWAPPGLGTTPPAAEGPRPPALPPGATPLLTQAETDPSLRMTVLPRTARVAIESNAGHLSLHLRIKDGKAEVHISGTLAPLFETRGGEIQTALAGEGLNLGTFDLTQGGGHDQAPPEPVDEAALIRSTGPTATDPQEPVTPGRRRIHVKA
jgi:hypothetical protein